MKEVNYSGLATIDENVLDEVANGTYVGAIAVDAEPKIENVTFTNRQGEQQPLDLVLVDVKMRIGSDIETVKLSVGKRANKKCVALAAAAVAAGQASYKVGVKVFRTSKGAARGLVLGAPVAPKTETPKVEAPKAKAPKAEAPKAAEVEL